MLEPGCSSAHHQVGSRAMSGLSCWTTAFLAWVKIVSPVPVGFIWSGGVQQLSSGIAQPSSFIRMELGAFTSEECPSLLSV